MTNNGRLDMERGWIADRLAEEMKAGLYLLERSDGRVHIDVKGVNLTNGKAFLDARLSLWTMDDQQYLKALGDIRVTVEMEPRL